MIDGIEKARDIGYALLYALLCVSIGVMLITSALGLEFWRCFVIAFGVDFILAGVLWFIILMRGLYG